MTKSLVETVNGVQEALANYIVAPATLFGLGGYVFDIEGESEVMLSAEITDHFIESNSTVQDHIALRPKRIQLSTFVGELVYYTERNGPTPVEKVARKITQINAFLPALTQSVMQARGIINTVRGADTFKPPLSPLLDIYAFVRNSFFNQNKQQQAYQYFKALMENRVLFSVQTPFEFCTDMAIESISATQDATTRTVSNFSLVLKHIRKVSTQTGILTTAAMVAEGRTGTQNQTEQNIGKIQGTPLPQEVQTFFDNL